MPLAPRPPARLALGTGTGIASATVIAGIWLGGVPFGAYIDPPSVVIVGGIVAGFQLAGFGVHRSAVALGLPLGLATATAERLAHATAWWLAAGTAALLAGAIGTLLGLVAILQNISDPTSIGAPLAVALLTTLYAALGAVGAFATALHVAHRDPEPAIAEATAAQAAATATVGILGLLVLDGVAVSGAFGSLLLPYS